MAASNRRLGKRSRREPLPTLMEVYRRWLGGLPIRLAAKSLRKAGIHPWSLALHASRHELEVLATALGLPAALRQARLAGPGWGLHFQDQDRLPRLPEGLVIESLFFGCCSGAIRLPRNLRVAYLRVEECPHLERVPKRCRGLMSLRAERCSRLQVEGMQMREEAELRLAACRRLRHLPKVRRLRDLTLKDLTGLRDLDGIREVKRLALWRLPGLRDLSATEVTDTLVIQACPDLQLLPRANRDVRGSVLDCSALLDQGFGPGVWDFPIEPSQTHAWYAPACEVSNAPDMGPSPLSGLCIAKAAEAWPWPPAEFCPITLDPALDLTMRGVGFDLLDRLRLHVGAGTPIAPALRGLLLQGRDPGEAVRLGASLLEIALARGDGGTAQQVCLEAERLGLGSLSLGLALGGKTDIGALAPLLGDFWAQRSSSARGYHLAHFQWYHATCVPGPLVLLRWAYVSENTELCCIDGPLWARLPLWFSDCSRLERLPRVMVAQASLTIESCPRLQGFPEWLEVAGDLVLRDLPRLSGHTCRIRVRGSVRVERCPGLCLIPIDIP